MTLKRFLKLVKLHEREISIVAGILILFAAGVFTIKYVRDLQKAMNNQTPVASPTPTFQAHNVTRGETLWSIAQKYYQDGVRWHEIADANHIDDPKKLETGQLLVIPVYVSPTPEPQILPVAASTSSLITGNNYTVVKGDCLWNIAVRAYGDGYKWPEIAKANNLHNPSLIHSGNALTIPR